MTTASSHPPVLPLLGILACDPEALVAGREWGIARLGPVLAATDPERHTYTDYYTAEMGADLRRQYLVFATPMAPTALAGHKLASNAAEIMLQASLGRDIPGRPVNLDPGYLDLPHVVLASCKPYSHRLPLGDGVYADLHLMFRAGAYSPMPWTYPDYAAASVRAFLADCRQALKARRRPDASPRSPDA